MSDAIIQCDRISKKYKLGYGGERRVQLSHAFTMRESFASAVQNMRRVLARERARPAAENVFWALEDVSFEVARGEVVGLIGRNGAGKSTLLKILSRIVEPTRGKAWLRGRVASLLEVGTGFHPELTGRENIYLNGAILGMRKAEIERKLDEIVAFSEIERFLDTPVKRYSSGMYVRLAFAVAAHLDPEILIVDEVLAVGDYAFQKKCMGKMRDVSSSSGRTILFVSHNMGALAQLCNRGILLEAGKIKANGPVADVIKTYMRSGSKPSESFVRFPVEKDRPGQFLTAEIMHQDGTHGVDFSSDEPIHLRFQLQLEEINSLIILQLFVRNSDGVLVLHSDARDKDFEISERLTKGLHTFNLVLPPELFTPGSYTLSVRAHQHLGGDLDFRENYCEFAIRNLQSKVRQAGIVGTRIRWQHQAAAPG